MTRRSMIWAGLLGVMLAAAWTGAAYSQAASPAPSGPTAGGPRTITLELKDADIRSALNMLFKESGFSYVLTPGVQGKVNASLHDMSWDQALRFILDSLDLSYRREDNVYYIERRGATSTPPSLTPPGPPVAPVAAGGTTAAGGQRIEIIKVLYSDPAMIAALFGGPSIGFLYSGGQGGSGLGQFGIGGYGYGNNMSGGNNMLGGSNTGFGNTGFGNTGFGNTGFGNTGFGNTGFGNRGFGTGSGSLSTNMYQ